MKVHDRTLPDDVVAELKRSLEAAAPALYVEHYGEDPVLARGFRKNSPELGRILKPRAIARIAACETLEGADLRFAAATTLQRDFVCVLSTQALQHVLPELAAWFGVVPLTLALLLDDRPDVRDLGADVRDAVPGDGPGKETARARIRERLSPFLHRMAAFLESAADDTAAAPPPAAAAACPDTVADVEAAVAAEQRRAAKQKQALEEKIVRLEEQMESMRRERKVLTEALHREQQDRRRACGEAERARVETEALRTRAGEEIRSQVAAGLEREVHAWLRAPRAVEATATGGVNADLLERTHRLLARQAEEDRHYGNVAKVRAQLGEIEAALATVESARANALQPVAGLREVADELKREAERLRNSLGPATRTPSPVVAALLARINESPEEGLPAVLELVDVLELNGILDPAAVALLHGKHRERMQRLFDPYLRGVGQPVRPRCGLALFVWHLCRDEAFRLIVDGHNVLLTATERYGGAFEQGRPGAAARQQLAGDLQRIAAGRRMQVDLFFDGPVASRESLAENVRLAFSGGTGEHRADDAMVEFLERMRTQEPEVPRYVVTNDNGLADRIRALGGERLTVGVFLDVLAAARR